jgi:hypothetical protein
MIEETNRSRHGRREHVASRLQHALLAAPRHPIGQTVPALIIGFDNVENCVIGMRPRDLYLARKR